VNISGLEQYRRTLLGLAGGVPTRFSLARGNPALTVGQWLIAAFAQDEWRVRQHFLLSLGVRYEAQTTPTNLISLAPRVGIAFSPDKKKHWVLRARAGVFYDRIGDALTLEAHRLDGVRQQQIIIASPSFPNPFIGATSLDVIPIVRRLDEALRPPASLQLQIGFEHQLPRGWKIEVSHYWTYGSSSLRSRNINAPQIVAGVDPLLAPRPLGIRENILQFESSGKIGGRVLFIGVNQSASKYFSLFIGYLNFDFRTNADTPFLLPQSSYDMSGEWARPFWQSRHRVFLVSTVNLPFKLRASVLFNAASGTPFNITTGRDNNGDSNFNDRPSVVDAANPQAIVTQFGALDPTAVNGTLSRNAGTNPPTTTLDLNLSRAFTFGKKVGATEGRYKLMLNARASNLLNHTNVIGGLNGVLASPFFGRANAAAPARRIEFGLRLSF